jgi:hypothetical protein
MGQSNLAAPDEMIRGLQLHQIERNFPFLLKVAHVLNTKVKAEGYTRLLLCSRDCYFLYCLMCSLFQEYEIEYFYTSRLMRYRPNAAYTEYAKSRITGKTLIVDMCGTGNSLKYFCDQFGGTPLLVVSSFNNVPSLVRGGIRETSNPAPHSTVDRWPLEGDYSIDPRIKAMEEAFKMCIADAVEVPEPTYTLDWALSQMEDPRTACLWADHLAESTETYKKLNSGPLPHSVIL